MPSGAWKGRKAIPAAVRVEYQRLYGPGREAIFWCPAGTAPQKAKADYAEWQALIGRRITALREAAAGGGQDLSQRQVAVLAGEWYRWFISQHEENPGVPSRWTELHDIWWNSLADTADPETGEIDTKAPEVREELYPPLTHGAQTDVFLTDRGVVLTAAGRTAFLSAVLWEFLAATKTLQRRASGDYGRDEHEDTLSPAGANGHSGKAKARRNSAGTAPTATELFQAYIEDKRPAPRTVSRWQGVFRALDGTNWQTPNWDAQGWLDGLKTEKRPDGKPVRKPITVRDIWLGAPRAVFSWAVRHADSGDVAHGFRDDVAHRNGVISSIIPI